MKLQAHTRRSGRPSFTLVELLIVLAIISVLLSLISASIWKALVVANRTRNRSEISQLAAAVENFKSRYGFYPPSIIRLAESMNAYNPNSQLDQDSLQILLRMFPNIASTWSSTGINWSGRKGGQPVNTILEGDQCLVFFLGGIPDNFTGFMNCTGFSTNPLNPAAHIPQGGDTLPPFFEFVSAQLVPPHGQATAARPFFYSYLDTYRLRPYVYFSSGNSRNNYNRHYLETKRSDCPSLMVWPYAEFISAPLGGTLTTARYLNPSSFQIISAGADGLFGPGTVINGSLGATKILVGSPSFPANVAVYDNSSPGYDDQSNFRESTIGSGN